MTTTIKNTLIERLTERFSNTTARAAAINEVLTASDYPSCFTAIVSDATDPIETLFNWSVRRGEVWS